MNYGSSSNQFDWVAYNEQILEEDNEAGKLEQLMNDYFVDNPVFHADDFRRQFGMKRHLLLRLVEDCEHSNPYFQRKLDRHKLGFSSLQKVTIMRMLVYAYSDAIDETFHMVETTATETLREFCKTILRLYKDEYVRAPTNADLTRLLDKAE
ncbi:hypothetical protein MIMGU_mgv11b023313mg [Erythranthe guttata]|uniref:Uncharacterized protein n=1 Tax=Erythranthe guttata TaxID=4155 RepID=A0A022QI17_ERYGU|nr:hypothetical protein MIMGU_mgv11b023313mg [Erythranthe guttata]